VIIDPSRLAPWIGDLVREPMYAVPFVTHWLSLAAASLFCRFR
jgi:hypothetical protein